MAPTTTDPYGNGLNQDLPDVTTICTRIQLRREAMARRFPRLRYNMLNPYSENKNLRKFDFDMRRKAEILKYTGNQTGSNGITKAQLFAKSNTANRSSFYGSVYRTDCNANDGIPKPAYYSNVPGSQMLYYHPKIPLYNYRSALYPFNIKLIEQYSDIQKPL